MVSKAQPIRILLAEDSRFLRRATELILAKAGYEVVTAADGIEALNVARAVSPDLIILDLMMPRMNGVDVLRSLKQDPATSAIPVIVLTGLSQKNDLTLLEAGAAAYYEKTKLIPEALEGIVQSVLAGARLEAGKAPKTKTPGANPPPVKIESGVYHALQGVLPAGSCQEQQQASVAAKERDYENELLDQIISLNTELGAAQGALAKANEELRRVAETDPLTEVPNRRKACYDIEKLLALARRQQETICFAILDLDNFKSINDTYGHSAGDNVLRSFGKFLSKSVRTEDVVGRWGGEEFVVVLYGCSVADAVTRLERLRERFIQERFSSEAGAFQVTFSGGVAAFPRAGTLLEGVYEAADRALYEAKKLGRNRITADQGSGSEPGRVEGPPVTGEKWRGNLAKLPPSAV
jgi:diguanylate cyclase (GGDEF)-like protein